MMGFQKAERRRVWLKLALTGPTGSGKTYSGLRLAFGLGERVALVDTENGSGSLYADLGEYDVMELHPPFTAQKYMEAVNEAVKSGYDVLIIDSLSHGWAGDGGLLDQKSAKDSRGGNSFSNWAEITKLHEQFKSALLQSPIHIIATMRSKMEYVQEADDRGKTTVKKVGLAPVQRDGIEYEFTTVFDIDARHVAATSKDRTGLFTDEVSQITEEHGQRLAKWLEGCAEPIPAPVRVAPAESVNTNGHNGHAEDGPSLGTLFGAWKKHGFPEGKEYDEYFRRVCGKIIGKDVKSRADLTPAERGRIITFLPDYAADVSERGLRLGEEFSTLVDAKSEVNSGRETAQAAGR